MRHFGTPLVPTVANFGLAGDTLDIAFTIGHNDHPEYGGLELSLRDFQSQRKIGS